MNTSPFAESPTPVLVWQPSRKGPKREIRNWSRVTQGLTGRVWNARETINVDGQMANRNAPVIVTTSAEFALRVSEGSSLKHFSLLRSARMLIQREGCEAETLRGSHWGP
jgi:hypothetical protein